MSNNAKANDEAKVNHAEGVAVTKSLNDGGAQPVVMGIAQSANSGNSFPGHGSQDQGHDHGPEGGAGQDWGTGLFDCTTDPYNCWDTILCHPCSIAMQFNKLFNNRSSVNWPMCLGVCATDVFLTGGIAIFAEALLVRFTLMNRYHLYGSGASQNETGSCITFFLEFLKVGFCTCCTTCQNAREMTLHGDWPGKVLFGKDPALTAMEAPGEVTIE